MSRLDWNVILKLPEPALTGNRRIPKSVFVRQASLTKTEQRILNKVNRLGRFATVQKSTTRIPSFVDNEYDVQSIILLRREMVSKNMALTEVAMLIHKCFQDSTILLLEADRYIGTSVALTRKGLAERGVMVINRTETTGTFDLDRSEYADFLGAMASGRLSQGDLWEYLLDLSHTIALSCAIDGLGFYPKYPTQDRKKLTALMSRYDELGASVKRLKEQRRLKDVMLNESAKLQIKMGKEKQHLQSTVAEIKETCND